MTLFTAVMLPLVVSLGLWQLGRAEEKRSYEDRFYERVGALPVNPPRDLADTDFVQVRLEGRYDPQRHFLIDNQVSDGKVGYQVISLFRSDDGRGWLINRGWIPADLDRARLPPVPTPGDRVVIVGVIWPQLGMPPLLAEDDWPAGWPKRVQRFDVSRMMESMEAVEPVEVRLEAGWPGVFAPARLEMVVSVTKHLGYAAQWLGLAVALAIGYLVFGFRKDG
jgi:cytochrome oxidase assembly protein ShyY1